MSHVICSKSILFELDGKGVKVEIPTGNNHRTTEQDTETVELYCFVFFLFFFFFK